MNAASPRRGAFLGRYMRAVLRFVAWDDGTNYHLECGHAVKLRARLFATAGVRLRRFCPSCAREDRAAR